MKDGPYKIRLKVSFYLITFQIEENAGAEAKFSNAEYEKAGARVLSRERVFQSDILLKVHQQLK